MRVKVQLNPFFAIIIFIINKSSTTDIGYSDEQLREMASPNTAKIDWNPGNVFMRSRTRRSLFDRRRTWQPYERRNVNIINANSRHQLRHVVPTLTSEEIDVMVRTHNGLRKRVSPSASNMRRMHWNDRLAKVASEYAANCIYAHSDNAKVGNMEFGTQLGENIYIISGGKMNLIHAIRQWYDEVKEYDYHTGHCSGMCGHYTQVVWANSNEIGCAYVYCKGQVKVRYSYWTDPHMLVCNYLPAGNVRRGFLYGGRVGKPYKTGQPCTQCAKVNDVCFDSLCDAADADTGKETLVKTTVAPNVLFLDTDQKSSTHGSIPARGSDLDSKIPDHSLIPDFGDIHPALGLIPISKIRNAVTEQGVIVPEIQNFVRVPDTQGSNPIFITDENQDNVERRPTVSREYTEWIEVDAQRISKIVGSDSFPTSKGNSLVINLKPNVQQWIEVEAERVQNIAGSNPTQLSITPPKFITTPSKIKITAGGSQDNDANLGNVSQSNRKTIFSDNIFIKIQNSRENYFRKFRKFRKQYFDIDAFLYQLGLDDKNGTYYDEDFLLFPNNSLTLNTGRKMTVDKIETALPDESLQVVKVIEEGAHIVSEPNKQFFDFTFNVKLEKKEVIEIVTMHDAFRADIYPSATNMKRLHWSMEIAHDADEYIRKCINVAHKHPTDNIKISPDDVIMRDAIEEWSDEQYNYDWETGKCLFGKCDHFFKLAQDAFDRVGCAKTKCSGSVEVDGTILHRPYVFMCRYGSTTRPMDEIITILSSNSSTRPYSAGTPCSSCARGEICVDNMCDTHPQVENTPQPEVTTQVNDVITPSEKVNLTGMISILPCLCENGGQCAPDLNKEPGLGAYECQCPIGFDGKFCNETDGACLPGLTGPNCLQDVDECQQSPCYEGVECTNTIGSFYCRACPDGYFGNGFACAKVGGEEYEGETIADVSRLGNENFANSVEDIRALARNVQGSRELARDLASLEDGKIELNDYEYGTPYDEFTISQDIHENYDNETNDEVVIPELRKIISDDATVNHEIGETHNEPPDDEIPGSSKNESDNIHENREGSMSIHENSPATREQILKITKTNGSIHENGEIRSHGRQNISDVVRDINGYDDENIHDSKHEINHEIHETEVVKINGINESLPPKNEDGTDTLPTEPKPEETKDGKVSNSDNQPNTIENTSENGKSKEINDYEVWELPPPEFRNLQAENSAETEETIESAGVADGIQELPPQKFRETEEDDDIIIPNDSEFLEKSGIQEMPPPEFRDSYKGDDVIIPDVIETDPKTEVTNVYTPIKDGDVEPSTIQESIPPRNDYSDSVIIPEVIKPEIVQEKNEISPNITEIEASKSDIKKDEIQELPLPEFREKAEGDVIVSNTTKTKLVQLPNTTVPTKLITSTVEETTKVVLPTEKAETAIPTNIVYGSQLTLSVNSDTNKNASMVTTNEVVIPSLSSGTDEVGLSNEDNLTSVLSDTTTPKTNLKPTNDNHPSIPTTPGAKSRIPTTHRTNSSTTTTPGTMSSTPSTPTTQTSKTTTPITNPSTPTTPRRKSSRATMPRTMPGAPSTPKTQTSKTTTSKANPSAPITPRTNTSTPTTPKTNRSLSSTPKLTTTRREFASRTTSTPKPTITSNPILDSNTTNIPRFNSTTARKFETSAISISTRIYTPTSTSITKLYLASAEKANSGEAATISRIKPTATTSRPNTTSINENYTKEDLGISTSKLWNDFKNLRSRIQSRINSNTISKPNTTSTTKFYAVAKLTTVRSAVKGSKKNTSTPSETENSASTTTTSSSTRERISVTTKTTSLLRTESSTDSTNTSMSKTESTEAVDNTSVPRMTSKAKEPSTTRTTTTRVPTTESTTAANFTSVFRTTRKSREPSTTSTTTTRVSTTESTAVANFTSVSTITSEAREPSTTRTTTSMPTAKSTTVANSTSVSKVTSKASEPSNTETTTRTPMRNAPDPKNSLQDATSVESKLSATKTNSTTTSPATTKPTPSLPNPVPTKTEQLVIIPGLVKPDSSTNTENATKPTSAVANEQVTPTTTKLELEAIQSTSLPETARPEKSGNILNITNPVPYTNQLVSTNHTGSYMRDDDLSNISNKPTKHIVMTTTRATESENSNTGRKIGPTMSSSTTLRLPSVSTISTTTNAARTTIQTTTTKRAFLPKMRRMMKCHKSKTGKVCVPVFRRMKYKPKLKNDLMIGGRPFKYYISRKNGRTKYSQKGCQKRCGTKGICDTNGICKCKPQYAGHFCERSACDTLCENKGICISRNNCKCVGGYFGALCEKFKCENPCQNGGDCVGPNTCHCTKTFTGSSCELPVCEPKCGNGGKCRIGNKCSCLDGYVGDRCEKATCTPGCQNGGVCMRKNICFCPKLHMGSRCQISVCSPRCENGGRCMKNNKCLCKSGWEGDHCTSPVCIEKCANGGVCVAPNQCKCKSGWSGSTCKTGHCRRCRFGSRCVRPNVCKCPFGTRGRMCRVRTRYSMRSAASFGRF